MITWRYRYLPRDFRVNLLASRPPAPVCRLEGQRFMTTIGLPPIVVCDRTEIRPIEHVSNALIAYACADESRWVCADLNADVLSPDDLVQPYEVSMREALDVATQLRMPLWVWVTPFACDVVTRWTYRDVYFSRPDQIWTYAPSRDPPRRKRRWPNAGRRDEAA